MLKSSSTWRYRFRHAIKFWQINRSVAPTAFPMANLQTWQLLQLWGQPCPLSATYHPQHPDQKQKFPQKKRGPWLDPTPTNNPTVPILRPKPETAVGCLGFPPHYQPRTLWQLTRGMWWGTCRGWPNVEANHVARSFHVMRVGQHPPVNPTRRDFVSPRSQTVPSVGFQSLVHSLIDFHALA